MKTGTSQKSSVWGSPHPRFVAALALVLPLVQMGVSARAAKGQRRWLSPSTEEIVQLWREPPKVCSQAPFWFWNGPLDPNTMQEQIRLRSAQ